MALPVSESGGPPARALLWAGIRAQAPILLGVMPFGMIYGVAAVGAGLPPAVALGMSAIVFAGSSQFVAAQLFAPPSAPGLVIVLTTFIVNLRHMLYSASLAPYVRHLGRGWRALLAFLLTDEVYAVTVLRYRERGLPAVQTGREHWFYLGAGLTLWTSWQVSSVIGVVLGASVPESWALDFTLPLTFIALLIPALTDRPTIGAALVAGLVAVLAHGLPYNLGLILAVLVGIGAGVLLEGINAPQRQQAAEPGTGR